MGAMTLESRVRIKDDVVYRDIDGEMVLLNLATGVYFGLDEVGSRIWHLLGAHQSFKPVIDALQDEYDVTEAQCAQDLIGLVAQMMEQGLVEVNASPAR